MQREQLEQIWNIFDKEQKGVVLVDKIIKKINKFGINLSNEALISLNLQLDPQRTGYCTFGTFEMVIPRIIMSQQNGLDEEDEENNNQDNYFNNSSNSFSQNENNSFSQNESILKIELNKHKDRIIILENHLKTAEELNMKLSNEIHSIKEDLKSNHKDVEKINYLESELKNSKNFV